MEGVGDVILNSENGYDKFLKNKGRQCLLFNGAEVLTFEDIRGCGTAGTYTLGPAIQQQAPPSSQSEEDRDLLRGIKRQLDNLQQNSWGRPTPMETPASLGSQSIADLSASSLISRLDGSLDPSMAPVLEADSIERLSQVINEHQVVAFMTAVFEDILHQSTIHVVNSEEYPWLVTTSNETRFNQKPDNIFCHSAIVNRRDPFRTTDPDLISLRRATDRYGILANWGLRDCIDVLGEAKVKIDNKSFGEVINYARHICYHKDAPRHTKLLLYDKSEFWMTRATLGEISSVTRCCWGSPGSRAALLSFFQEGRSPWIILLETACEYWNLEAQNDSFLGKGTFGRVFKVSHRGEERGRKNFKALKLVLSGNNGSGGLDLFKEKESLEKAAKILGDSVVSVDGFSDFGKVGSAMLMADIGGQVPRTAWRQLFETLGAFHEKNILHGDPRLANAIFVQGSVRWIDFRNSVVAIDSASVAFKRQDMRILVESCCNKLGTSLMGRTAVEGSLQQYNGTPSSAEVIYEALSSTF